MKSNNLNDSKQNIDEETLVETEKRIEFDRVSEKEMNDEYARRKEYGKILLEAKQLQENDDRVRQMSLGNNSDSNRETSQAQKEFQRIENDRRIDFDKRLEDRKRQERERRLDADRRMELSKRSETERRQHDGKKTDGLPRAENDNAGIFLNTESKQETEDKDRYKTILNKSVSSSPQSIDQARGDSLHSISQGQERSRRHEKYEREKIDFNRRIDMCQSPIDKERLTNERDLSMHQHESEQKSYLLAQGQSSIGNDQELKDRLKSGIADHDREASELRKKLEPENHAYHRSETRVEKARSESVERNVTCAPASTRKKIDERSQTLELVRGKDRAISRDQSMQASKETSETAQTRPKIEERSEHISQDRSNKVQDQTLTKQPLPSIQAPIPSLSPAQEQKQQTLAHTR